MLRVDHVVIAVQDLDRAAAVLLEQHGFASLPGGRHEEWGTANRLVPVGEQYLELLAVEDPTAEHPLARAVRGACAEGDRLLALCCETDDLDGVAARIGSPVVPGRRQLPDGREVTWRLTGLEASLTRGLPFFIDWGPGRELRFGGAVADHRRQPREVSRVDHGGEPAELRDWLGDVPTEIRLVGGPSGPRAVVIATGDGDVVLASTRP